MRGAARRSAGSRVQGWPRVPLGEAQRMRRVSPRGPAHCRGFPLGVQLTARKCPKKMPGCSMACAEGFPRGFPRMQNGTAGYNGSPPAANNPL